MMKRALGLVAALGVAGCVEADDAVETGETTQGAFVLMGNIYQGGTLVSFDNVTNVTGIDLSKMTAVTACDATALYAVESTITKWSSTYALYFSNDGGRSWGRQATLGKSAEIACDHARLLTLDSGGQLYTAPLTSKGGIGAWTKSASTIKVNRIQGGDGTFYGVKRITDTSFDIYTASGRSVNADPEWGLSPIATVGANQVTGTGIVMTNHYWVGNAKSWSRRAFALETNGTISTNSSLLANSNWWTSLDTGSERYIALTAGTPNVLYGIQNKAGVRQLNRIRITETTCGDGIDNDFNGLIDGEDPACTQAIANAFCSGHANGTYCADRYQPVTFLEQPNQNAAMTRCQNQIATVTPGVCVRNPNPNILNADSQPSYEAMMPAEPANTGHYCNVHWSDGTWGFSWTGTDPCETLMATKPGQPATIVRAGLYSKTAANTVFAVCSDGWVSPAGSVGIAPLQAVFNAVGKTTNKCIFQVSMTALPLFDHMVNPDHEIGVANPFSHAATPVDLTQFNHNESGMAAGIDRFGYDVGAVEAAYDLPVDEGRPVYAASNGIVMMNGSRIRPLHNATTFECAGSPNQGELWIKHGVGTTERYRETFVVGYMHLRKRVVVDGQTVKAGQLVGYAGAGGCTGGVGHVHVGVQRLSNTNAHTATQPELGYHFDMQPTMDDTGSNTGGNDSIDPLGWSNGSAFDPWAYFEWNTAVTDDFNHYRYTGKGAWSINLFKSGQEFDYP